MAILQLKEMDEEKNMILVNFSLDLLIVVECEITAH
jgi:hypothetical protein